MTAHGEMPLVCRGIRGATTAGANTAEDILEATQELSARPRLVSEAEHYGRRHATGVVCPALRARGFRVTGATPA